MERAETRVNLTGLVVSAVVRDAADVACSGGDMQDGISRAQSYFYILTLSLFSVFICSHSSTKCCLDSCDEPAVSTIKHVSRTKRRREGGREGTSETESTFSKMQTRQIWKRDKNVSGLMMSTSAQPASAECLCRSSLSAEFVSSLVVTTHTQTLNLLLCFIIQ